jgi:hypothetical protein
MPVTTAMVLGVRMQTLPVAALVAMIAQLFGMAMVYPGKYTSGIFVFSLVIGTRKQPLESLFTSHDR